MKKIKLFKGYVIVPDNTIVVDISDGRSSNFGIIADWDRKLKNLVVLSDKSLSEVSDLETDQIIYKATKNLPEYSEAKKAELPIYFKNNGSEEEINWDCSVRLRLYPWEQLNSLGVTDYTFHENGIKATISQIIRHFKKEGA